MRQTIGGVGAAVTGAVGVVVEGALVGVFVALSVVPTTGKVVVGSGVGVIGDVPGSVTVRGTGVVVTSVTVAGRVDDGIGVGVAAGMVLRDDGDTVLSPMGVPVATARGSVLVGMGVD